MYKLITTAKNLYIFVRYIFHRYVLAREFVNCKLYKEIKLCDVSKANESFFGYYNLSPENKNGDVICCEPIDAKTVNLVLYQSNTKKIIDTTQAWNWQQSCMLQWGKQNADYIYYNVFDRSDNSYKTKIYDTKQQALIKTLSAPIYALSPQENYALSLNFQRLANLRPCYGYFCKDDNSLPDNNEDGIWKINLNDNSVRLLISLSSLIKFNYSETMNGAEHKVNHIDIAPDGKRFMFLHRWKGKAGRFTRLVTADADGGNLYIVNGDKMTSHCSWCDNRKIVSYCYTEQYGNAYVYFEDLTDSCVLVSKQMPSEDGHCTLSPDGKYLVTDTYPGLKRIACLYLYDINQDKLISLAKLYIPQKYTRDDRIDLHPKWNLFGDKIYFESGHTGYRQLYYIDLKNILL